MSETTHDEQTPGAEVLEDFDAFWQTRQRKRKTTRIMGELVELPPALPLQYELEAKRLERSNRVQDVHKLVALLFGDDAFERWAAKGMDLDQFQVLLAWAPQAIANGDKAMTLAQVADELDKYQAGKAKRGKRPRKS